MKNTNFYLLGLGFLFLLLQSSVVWINEEILLVISFILFYVLCHLQLRNSLNEFFIERRNLFQNNFFISWKELAIKDLKTQKQFQYFKIINLANMSIIALEKEDFLFNLGKKNLQESKRIVFEKKCMDVLHFEELYRSEMLNVLTTDLLIELFGSDMQKNASFLTDYFVYQIVSVKADKK